MAHLLRIASGLLLVLSFAMIWTPVHAAFPATPGYSTYDVDTGVGWTGPQTTMSAACTSADSILRAAGHNPGTWTISGTTCAFTIYGNYPATVVSQPATCPVGGTLSGSTCTCSAGYVEEGGTCVSQQVFDDAACKALSDGLNLVGAPMVHYGSVGLTACFGGYVMAGTGAASGGGQTELYGPFKCSGASASACSVVPKPADITANCAPGSYPGTVNGVQVCIPPTDTVTAPKETTATPPAPGASAPQIPGAPPGTTSTTETTTCTNGSCTTTINYKDGAGESLGKKEDVKSQPQFCTENPKAPGCAEVDASKFSGSCDSGFTYKGDAIVGAMAAEIHRQNCLLNKSTEESGLYDTERLKTGDQTSTLPGNEVVNIGSGSFDSSDAIGGAACLTNKTIVVWGRSVVLPFSDVCPALGYLKNILLAISWFTAAGIVIGRKT